MARSKTTSAVSMAMFPQIELDSTDPASGLSFGE